MKTLILIPILTLTIFISCIAQHSVGVLEGVWKIEGKERYEAWEKAENGDLIGESYKLREGSKMVSETLLIKMIEDITVYEATVPDQNDGRSIQFTLNPVVKDALSFENPEHDFPSKIIYQIVDRNRLFVQVQTADGKGFSFYMDRQ
jgi:hypothetical protein